MKPPQIDLLPVRAAVRADSPVIFDVLAVLGREESLGRLRDAAG